MHLTQTLHIFGASAHETLVLGLNLEAFIIQLITFVLAIVILQRFAVKPMLKMLDKRRETIEQGVNLGEQMRKDKADMDNQVAEELQKARREADKLIASAEDTAKSRATDIETKAKQKAETIIESAEDRINQEATAARKRLESELATLVADTASAVLEEKVDDKKDVALIDRLLKNGAKL